MYQAVLSSAVSCCATRSPNQLTMLVPEALDQGLGQSIGTRVLFMV